MCLFLDWTYAMPDVTIEVGARIRATVVEAESVGAIRTLYRLCGRPIEGIRADTIESGFIEAACSWQENRAAVSTSELDSIDSVNCSPLTGARTDQFFHLLF